MAGSREYVQIESLDGLNLEIILAIIAYRNGGSFTVSAEDDDVLPDGVLRIHVDTDSITLKYVVSDANE